MNPVVQEDLEAILTSRSDWNRLFGKRFLISGAAGFLPAYMVRTVLALNETYNAGCEVVGLVRNRQKAVHQFGSLMNNPGLRIIEGDVSEKFDPGLRCDFVIHAASPASPVHFGADPVGTMKANLLGSCNLLELAQEWQSERFLLLSTGEVYGKVKNVPTAEDDYGAIEILDPRSCYGEGKRAAETLTVSYISQFQIEGAIVRPFHTYGPGMRLDDGRVFADFVRAVIEGRDLELFSDGSAIRAFCYLADAVSGFFTVLLDGENGKAYNVGNPEGALSIRDLAELLVKLRPEKNLSIRQKERVGSTYMPSPIDVNVPNIDRVKTLGWNPAMSPSQGFDRTLRSFELLETR